MAVEPLLSSAYFPPSVYFSIMASSDSAVIERWENYHKQTYRNRCMILGANGPLTLTVPVLRGSLHKTAVRDIEIDNSRSWRRQHIRSIISAYALAPYFEYYFEHIEKAISGNYSFLLDYNMQIIESINDCIGIKTVCRFSDVFKPLAGDSEDYRYRITPKINEDIPGYKEQRYPQVFSDRFGFTPGLSIIDMLLNNGPGTYALLHRSPD